MTFVERSLPFCLLPTLTKGHPNAGVSLIPLEEFPTQTPMPTLPHTLSIP